MTTLCIDGKEGKLYSDSRTSWGGWYGEFIIPLKIPFGYRDDRKKIHKVSESVWMLGCGSAWIIDYVREGLLLGEGAHFPSKDRLSEGDGCKVFLVTRKYGNTNTLCLDLSVTKGFWKTKVVLEKTWYKNKVLFSGSGGQYAYDSFNRKSDILHAMYVAKQRDKYTGGDIEEITI